ncbi:hypothetical protein [Marivirga sp.]|uniref:hypothetical protein n=1 Tax=Marivirga sp. TaxID=2018662 RepID=UPI002D7F0901|nr:hypothetical protein [Marivirga sp.]HET8859016.1 hypothetical protein [Marivirga sp.]
MTQDKDEPEDYENIKLGVEKIYGHPIKYAKQCKELSQKIEESTGRLVSTATLRRFFQLMKSSSNPSRYTLETIVLYITSEKSRNEIDHSSFDNYLQTKQYCELIISKSKTVHQLVDELLNQNYTRVSLNPKLGYLLELAIKNENTDLVLSFYQNQKALTAQTDFYKIFGAFLNAYPENSLILLSKLAKNEVVRLNFYENFVNTGNFKVYQHWLRFYKLHEENPQKKLWADAILLWGDLLSKKEIDWEPFIEGFKEWFQGVNEAHPMLKARVYGVALFCSDLKVEAENHLHNILDNESNHFKVEPAFTPFASLLITQYLLLANQKELLLKVLKNINQPTYSTEYIVKSIPFFEKLIHAFLNDKNTFEFDEVLMVQSGFTNEDYLLKAFALRFLKERDEESISDYVESIISNNDFILLSDISRRILKKEEMRFNFG